MNFPTSPVPIKSDFNGSTYFLTRLDQIEPTAEQTGRIASICNEPLVFDWLFKELFPGGVYPESSAEDWIKNSTDEWNAGTGFGFVVVDEGGLVVAACDVKTNDLKEAEIGYWASSHHRGVLSNAATAMLEMARELGFRGFRAVVNEKNLRSQAVMGRLGFVKSGSEPRRPGYVRYRG